MALAVCFGSSEDRRKEAGVWGVRGRRSVQPQGAYGQPSEVDAVFSIRMSWLVLNPGAMLAAAPEGDSVSQFGLDVPVDSTTDPLRVSARGAPAPIGAAVCTRIAFPGSQNK